MTHFRRGCSLLNRPRSWGGIHPTRLCEESFQQNDHALYNKRFIDAVFYTDAMLSMEWQQRHESKCSRHARLRPLSNSDLQGVRRFLYEVGTALWVLERGTQLADLAERFFGLLNYVLVLLPWVEGAIMNLTVYGTLAQRITSIHSDYAWARYSNIATFGWLIGLISSGVILWEDRNFLIHKIPHATADLGGVVGA